MQGEILNSKSITMHDHYQKRDLSLKKKLLQNVFFKVSQLHLHIS